LKERVERLEQVFDEFIPNGSLAPVVRALQASRGVDLIVAVTFATEVGDAQRLKGPRQLMRYLGLVLEERSTGETVRRDGITKTGNGRVRHMLVEGAWTYRHPPRIGRAESRKIAMQLAARSSCSENPPHSTPTARKAAFPAASAS
jgi:transposase